MVGLEFTGAQHRNVASPLTRNKGIRPNSHLFQMQEGFFLRRRIQTLFFFATVKNMSQSAKNAQTKTTNMSPAETNAKF